MVFADCDLFVRLSGCVRDAGTGKPLIEARIFYGTTVVFTDDRGCFVISETSVVAEGDFFPTTLCVTVFKPGYELVRSCQRRESFEPFPPCPDPPALNLSLSYGVISVPELTTGVSDPEAPALPQGFELYQNYPNPFNPVTEIGFMLAAPSAVRLDVFDVLGRHVVSLHRGRLPAGAHEVGWDARDVAAGVYFYRLRVDDQVQVRKMVLLK
jgi:hypothetical protein